MPLTLFVDSPNVLPACADRFQRSLRRVSGKGFPCDTYSCCLPSSPLRPALAAADCAVRAERVRPRMPRPLPLRPTQRPLQPPSCRAPPRRRLPLPSPTRAADEHSQPNSSDPSIWASEHRLRSTCLDARGTCHHDAPAMVSHLTPQHAASPRSLAGVEFPPARAWAR